MNESIDSKPKQVGALDSILSPRTAQNVVGALVIASIVGLVGIVRTAWTALDALGDVQREQAGIITHLRQNLVDLRTEFIEFRRPGARYTQQNADLLELKILRAIEGRKIPPPEVRNQLDDHEKRLTRIETQAGMNRNYMRQFNSGAGITE